MSKRFLSSSTTPGLRRVPRPVGELAKRGDSVHVADLAGRPEDSEALERATEGTNVTHGRAPRRGRSTGGHPWHSWRARWATSGRVPDLHLSTRGALRDRMVSKGREPPLARGRIRPGTRRLALRRARSLHEHTDLALPSARSAAAPSSRRCSAQPRITEFIQEHDPDVLLVSPLIDLASPLVDYLKAARSLGLRTGICVASWDNLTSKGLLRFVPERVFVWNEAQREEAVSLHGIPPDRVVATGAAASTAGSRSSRRRSGRSS